MLLTTRGATSNTIRLIIGLSTKLLAYFGILMLSACSLLPKPDAPGKPSRSSDVTNIAQYDLKTALQCWTIEGKFGFKPTDKTRYKSASARLRWRQDGEAFSIRLSGPLGQGTVLLDGSLIDPNKTNTQTVTLTQSDAIPQLVDADQLLSDILGHSFPLHYLTWWLRGLPAPTTTPNPLFSVDENQHLVELHQGDWLVTYPRLQTVNAISLPRTVKLKHPQLSATLSLNRWSNFACQIP